MTIQELYAKMGGDYDQAVRVMKKDKLIDKYVRKLTASNVGEMLAQADKTMDGTKLFESAHAMKGVCSNLGLVALANAADEITEEFRPGNARKLSDEQVKQKLQAVIQRYEDTTRCIREYEAQG
jgi:HPt (histidine-containing phosphotransfer) domain-containing protein